MKFQLLLVLALMFSFTFEASAVNSTVAVENSTVSLTNDNQKSNVFTKASTWIQKKTTQAKAWVLQKMEMVDLEDPASVIKWSIILFLAGVVLWALALTLVFAGVAVVPRILFYLSYIAGTVAWVGFLYWLYLKYFK